MNKYIVSLALTIISMPIMADDISDTCSLAKTFATSSMNSRQRGTSLETHLEVLKTGLEAIDGLGFYSHIKGVAAAAWNAPILSDPNEKAAIAIQFGQLVETQCIADLKGE